MEAPIVSRGIAGGRTHLRAGLLCAATAIIVFAGVGTAQAERAYESQITGLTNPWGVSIDSGDNVWISQPEGGGGVIVKHDPFPSQTQLAEQTGEGHYGPGYIRSMALDNVNGHLYVADSGPETVDVFDPVNFVEQWGVGGGYVYLAVDNSGGASNGRVYVIKASGGLLAFDPNHNPVDFSASAAYISGNKISGTPGGNFGQGWNVSVDLEGNIYVVDAGKRVVDEFSSSGEFAREFDGSGAPGGFVGELTGVAVDPTNGDVLIVDNGNGVVDEFAAGGEYLGQLTGPPGETFGTMHGGIAVSSNGYAYVADASSNVVDIFGPNAILPKVSFGAVTNQSQTSGTIHASIDLNEGPEVTSCAIQYGTTTAYGSSVACSPAPPYSSSPTAISAELSGLTTETPYHYRVVLVTANGTKKSSDQTFQPHAVAGLTTNPATSVERNSATLNATFNGDGEDTHYFFEWGPTTSYGNTTAPPPGTLITAPSGPQNVSFELTSLQVETTYHYRVVASNSTGTSYGLDQSFKTLAAVESLSTDPATAITASTVALNASFTGIGEDIHYFFEWGTNNSYGSTTPASPGTLLSGPSGPQAVAVELSGLRVNTSYHFRVVATDAAGATYGSDRTFRTLGAYEFSTYLGTAGSGDGQLANPRDVAVDETNGDIYVADSGNHRVVKFDSSGGFLAAWGWGVDDGSAASQVCTGGCEAGIPGSGAGQLTKPTFIEVDNSGGPSAGDVYVADEADGVVQKFDSSGNLVTGWGDGGAIDRSHDGSIGGITVDTAGDLFTLAMNSPHYWTEIGQDGVFQSQTETQGCCFHDLGGPNGSGIDISPSGLWYETQEIGGGVAYTSPTAPVYSSGRLYGETFGGPLTNSGLVIDRLRSDVYVDQGSYIDQFPGANECDPRGCLPSDTFGEGKLSSAAGLAIRAETGTLYAANVGGNDVAVFSPLPTAEVSTGSATSSGPTSGTLTGHVDPNGAGSISDCRFEYGTDTTYGLGIVPCSPSAPISGPVDVSAEINGLTPLTSYHYRLVAIRADGKGFPKYGRDRTFTPAPPGTPTIDSVFPSNISPTTATLNGLIRPNQAPTIYRFQYGLDSDYGLQTPASESIGEDSSDHAVSNLISGLQPGTTYHFRIIATNFNGSIAAPDQTFTTPDLPAIAQTSASGITPSSVVLAAGITPRFRSTTYHFEYGLTSGYEARTTESGSIGEDDTVHSVTVPIAGLAAGTVYHYRIVATNSVGSAAGPDGTFTTPPNPPTVTPPKPLTCKPGLVKRHGKCVRKPHHKKTHHRRSHR